MYGDFPIQKRRLHKSIAKKRLDTTIRNKIKGYKFKGITLDCKKQGNLTEGFIIKVQNYYWKQIKGNASNIGNMKTSVVASF